MLYLDIMDYATAHKHRYPHLGSVESAAWDRWLRAHAPLYSNYTYDVHVGKGANIDIDVEDKMKKMYTHLTQKRIDVVGRRGRNIGIIEIRPRATLSVIGALVAYVFLWKKDTPGFWNIKIILITERIDDDTKYAAKANKIQVYTV